MTTKSKSKIVRTTVYPGQKPTEEQLENLKKAEKFPIVFDEDSPEKTYDELIKMAALTEARRAERKKEVVTLRLSGATLKKAKAFGKGYTGFLARLIDNALNDKDLVARSL